MMCDKTGRHMAMMPHIERFTFQWNWAHYPKDSNDEVTPWHEAFVNAVKWIATIYIEKGKSSFLKLMNLCFYKHPIVNSYYFLYIRDSKKLFMKSVKLIFAAMILCVNQSFTQTKITKITAQNQVHYITTKIDYPIFGTYQYEKISEPIVILNLDGTGIFENNDLSKKEIIWGLECTEDGFLRFIEGFDSAAYSIWFKSKDSLINSELVEINDWKKVEFSIHFNTKKMYIMGERIKDYVD